MSSKSPSLLRRVQSFISRAWSGNKDNLLLGSADGKASAKEMWNLETGLALARRLEKEVSKVGWHAALAGGVMKIGNSSHDLDIVFYPHCKRGSHIPNKQGLFGALRRVGLERIVDRRRILEGWRARGSIDNKWVEVWDFNGRRVDVIIVA